MSEPVWDLVHIITQLELGGAQLATLHEVANCRFATGQRSLLVGPGGMLDEEARGLDGVRLVSVPALGRPIALRDDLSALRQLVAALTGLRRRASGARLLVHTHSSKAGILGRVAAAVAGADAIVHSIHGFGHSGTQAPPLRHALLGLEQMAAHLTDGFTADSAANLAQARAEAILADQPARVVRCAIDVDQFATPAHPAPQVRQALGVPVDHHLVLSLACLKAQKDPLALVRVASLVIAQRPRTTFLIAGDGELRPAMERLIAFFELGDRVRLLGWRRDVPDLLHACELLLSTSLWEGLPQAFAQAMAARRPIVATRVDGNPEAVTHGDNGLLFSSGDVEGMAAGVISLLDDAERRQAMGEAGHSRVGEFSLERMVAELDDFYGEVTSKPRRRLRVAALRAQASHLWARTWPRSRV